MEMYLSKLVIENFRKIEHLEIDFNQGINLLIGPNNSGKTTIIDAIRALVFINDDNMIKINKEDINRKAKEAGKSILFEYYFSNLNDIDGAVLMKSVKLDSPPNPIAKLCIEYWYDAKTDRVKTKRWYKDNKDAFFEDDIINYITGMYLPALRDASFALRPYKNNVISKLLNKSVSDADRKNIIDLIDKMDDDFKKTEIFQKTKNLLSESYNTIVGQEFSQNLDLQLSPSDLLKLTSRISLLVDELDIELNGSGYNNIIYMSLVLSTLVKPIESAYLCMLIEEPEAHLHPQLQESLLEYFKSNSSNNLVQIFLTSHSPNIASSAELRDICIINSDDDKVYSYRPSVDLLSNDLIYKKFQRFLDVTRAEIFFSKRAILVEGISELLVLNAVANLNSYNNFKRKGVSVISLAGLNFDCFARIIGSDKMRIRASIITDGDPEKDTFPSRDSAVATHTYSGFEENNYVRYFVSLKTFEYDILIQSQNNINIFMKAFTKMHPSIANEIHQKLEAIEDIESKARVIFTAIFIDRGNISKGQLSQELASVILESGGRDFDLPNYLQSAINHVCA